MGASGYLMYPTSLLIQSTQAIEMQNQVALSDYSFELINNKLRIFPVPTEDGNKIWFQYLKIDDRINSIINSSPGVVTNVSNASYSNPTYTQINSIGRQWIFEYSLALCKEMLGYIRGKYTIYIYIMLLIWLTRALNPINSNFKIYKAQSQLFLGKDSMNESNETIETFDE
jgi:hypothetical protein